MFPITEHYQIKTGWIHTHSRVQPLFKRYLLDHILNYTYFSTSDGVTRTGTFICIHSQLERLKTEGVVDVFQAIKSARIQRPGIIPNLVGSSTLYVM